MAEGTPSTFKLSVTPIKPSSIPSEEAILSAGKAILESLPTWKPGKTYRKVVKTSSQGTWHCRISEHSPEEATFDQMWLGLGENKAVNEKEFIGELNKVTKVIEISPTQQIWTLYYKFSPPVSPRVFTVLQVTHLSQEPPRTGIIVSIPVDLSEDPELAKLEEKGVRARYTSVERLKELENGKTEWVMATSSITGGMIPAILSEGMMNSKISDDVPHFLKWMRSLPENQVPKGDVKKDSA